MDMENRNSKEDSLDHTIVDDVIDSKTLEASTDFRQSFSDLIDRRFISVLLGSFVYHIAFVTYFLLNPLPHEEAMERASRMQEQLARTLRERELEMKAVQAKLALNQPKGDKPKPKAKKPMAKKPKADKPKANKSAAKKGTKTKSGGKAKKSRRPRPSRGSRGKSRARIASAVSSRGVLALLTSTSSVASGNEVADILSGKKHTQKDLDKAISGLSGIKTAGNGTSNGVSNVKGGRSRGGGSIDDLVSDLGDADGGSFERAGELVVVGESALVEGGTGSGIIGRGQDDVQGVIVNHNLSVQYCYQRELKRNPNLKGKLVVRFSIAPDGSVKSVEIVSSTLNNRKVERCVVNRIRRWNDFGSIDQSYGDTTIRQTYAFGY